MNLRTTNEYIIIIITIIIIIIIKFLPHAFSRMCA